MVTLSSSNPRTVEQQRQEGPGDQFDKQRMQPPSETDLDELRRGRGGEFTVARAVTLQQVKSTLDDFRRREIGGPGGLEQLERQMREYDYKRFVGGGMDCIKAQNMAVDALQQKFGNDVRVFDVRRDIPGPREHHILGYSIKGGRDIYGYDPIMNIHHGVVGRFNKFGDPIPANGAQVVTEGKAER